MPFTSNDEIKRRPLNMAHGGDEIHIAVIGDIHGELYHLKKVLDHLAALGVDALLLVGDFGSPEFELSRWRKDSAGPVLLKEMRRVFSLVERINVPFLWVPGNHDYADVDLPGNCDRRLVEVAGIKVFGIGGAGPGRFGFPYEWDEDEVRALTVPPCDVVLSHAPPARTPLDKLFHAERHVGSEAVREIAERHPGVLVCGHIHEAYGTEKVGHSLCMNVGSLGDPYGSIQVGFVIYSRSRQACTQVIYENLLTGKKQIQHRDDCPPGP
jgi:Icc-related predicted phosphoesterase